MVAADLHVSPFWPGIMPANAPTTCPRSGWWPNSPTSPLPIYTSPALPQTNGTPRKAAPESRGAAGARSRRPRKRQGPRNEWYDAGTLFDDDRKFRDYLEAKTTVDDRALNHRIWLQFVDEITRLAQGQEGSGGSGAFTMLDLGTGFGDGIRRMLDRDVFRGFPEGLPVNWTAVDRSAAAVKHARATLEESERRFSVEAIQSDIASFAKHETRRFHAIVAHAVLDMLDLDEALPAILSRLLPGGIGYFPICFDGVTIFEPADALDNAVIGSYHRSMSPAAPGARARSQTGRTLLARLRDQDVELLAVGSSDWIVCASRDGYPHREGFFLSAILHLIERAVAQDPTVDESSLAEWLDRRRRQLDATELVYIAHQLDYLIRRRRRV